MKNLSNEIGLFNSKAYYTSVIHFEFVLGNRPVLNGILVPTQNQVLPETRIFFWFN